MYCDNCGKKNPKNSKFCQYCGKKISEELSIDKENTINNSIKNKSKWKSVGGILIAILVYTVGSAFGHSLGITIIFLIIAWLIGYWFSAWFIKNHANSKSFSIIAWLNVITWLSPVLGFLTAGVTYKFAQVKQEKKYTILWILAAVLALSNAFLYPYFSISNGRNSTNTSTEVQPNANKVIDNTQSVIDITCDNQEGGSGTIISQSGYILTNNHVIKGAISCLITLPDTTTGQPKAIYTAKPVIIPDLSQQYDLAFLSITGAYTDSDGKTWGTYPTKFPAFNFSNNCSNYTPHLGDDVRIYGYPVTSGGYNLTVTDGIVSSFDDNNDVLTSAKIDSGNSGGLAVSKNGCFVGVPSAVVSGNYQNLGVIIPASIVGDFANKLETPYQSSDNATTENQTFNVSCLSLNNGQMYGNSYYNNNPTYIASLYNGCSQAVKDVVIKVNFYPSGSSIPADTQYVDLGIAYLDVGDAHAINGTIATPFDTSGTFNWDAEVYSADPY